MKTSGRNLNFTTKITDNLNGSIQILKNKTDTFLLNNKQCVDKKYHDTLTYRYFRNDFKGLNSKLEKKAVRTRRRLEDRVEVNLPAG